MPIRIPMKQSTRERRSSLFKISFSLWLALSFQFSSVSFAQLTTETGPAPNSYGSSATMGSSGAALNADLIQQGQYDMANRAYADAVAQQQAALAAQQAAQAQQAALLAQQQAMNPAASTNSTAQLLSLCGALLSGTSGIMGGSNKRTSQEILDATSDYNSTAGYTYEKDTDQAVAASVGAKMSSSFGQGCSQFMNKQGQLGPWGHTTLANIRENNASFGTEPGSRYPSDITGLCPKYGSMDKTQREYFWVWVFASMAENESSCRTTKDTNVKAAYGTAYGIFQLEYKNNRCPGSTNLNDPDQNISCAVRQLGKELSVRPTLRSSCSATCPRSGTYWGTLRSDTNNNSSAMKAADNKGAIRTLTRIKQYQYCN